MNFESILFYVTHHSEALIQWLFLTILLMAGFLIWRTMFAKKEAEGLPASAGAESSEMRIFLQKIMDQTAKLETLSLENAGPAAAAAVDAQVQALKLELKNKESELEKAKLGDGKLSEDSTKLNSRIKELESKLAEYEILEDDIADLSLYKEENSRLRQEVDRLKGSGGVSAPADAVTAAPMSAATDPLVAAAAHSDDIVAEFAQAVSQEVGSGGATLEIKETGDPMADFAAAVEAEKKVLSEQLGVPAASSKPAAAAAKIEKPAGDDNGEADDLFAEFSEPTTASEPEAAPAAAGAPAAATADEESGELDTDKMMAEMAALVGVKPAVGSSLNEDIDTDKMAAEATKLAKS